MQICGFDIVFEKFCELNPAAKGCEHDTGKVRDKYTEILDAVGIDASLLRATEKIKSYKGKTIKGGSYIFPVEYVEFCAKVINRYTTKDFKNIRSANFRDASLGEIEFLIDGFSTMIIKLGYSHEIYLQQYRAMERRMHYKIRLSEKLLADQLQKIQDQAEDYENSVVNFNYDDSVYFIRHMASRVAALQDYFGWVYQDYTDGRSEELYDLAEIASREESSQESCRKVNMELAYGDALEHDDEYQKLIKKMEHLLAEENFVKNKQARFNKLQTQLEEIRKQHQMELFGELLPEEPDLPLTVKHPLTVLREAIEYTEERYADRVGRDEAEARKTPEDIENEKIQADKVRKFLESKGMNFDLPNTDEEEEKIFMESGNLAYKLKGIIPFPCCPKEKIMAYEGSSGKCSIKCPKCGRYAIFDYDKMEAVPGETLRGAAHKLKKK
jgi:hypothetical protein